jgi:hypothetical protein
MIKMSLCFITRHVIKAYGGVKHTSTCLHCTSYVLNEGECSVALDTAIKVIIFLSKECLYKRQGNYISNEILIYASMCVGGKEICVLAYRKRFGCSVTSGLSMLPFHPSVV